MPVLFLEFDAIVRQFYTNKINYAVVGGLAIGLHGKIRATEDIDFLIDEDSLESVIEILTNLGYKQGNKPWTFRNSKLTLWRFHKPVRNSDELYIVDLLVAKTMDNLDIIKRAVELSYAEIKIRVASTEDLTTMKLHRGSEQDKADIAFLQKKK